LFTQAERTPDRAQGGLGLGLALVKSIVELHDGLAQVASEGTGKGSTFAIMLPMVGTEHEISDATLMREHQHDGAGLRVLIVDDNQDAGTMLGYMLEAAGYMVRVESDAASAIRASREFGVEVFILDIGLPDMDGYELARRLRADERNAGTAIIALTGYGQAEDRALSDAAGFDHHFVKPADHKELLQILTSLGISRMRKTR